MSEERITFLLNRWSQGDREALDCLISLVYDELRAIASRYLRNQPDNFSLQSTALVHEAYLRLAGKERLDLHDRVHFFAVAAKIIRGILVDHARARQAAKRGGSSPCVPLLENAAVEGPLSIDLLQLDEVLDELELLDSQQSRIVEMRYFAGLSVDETAECLRLSSATVKRDWVLAKAWMFRKLI